VLDVHPPDHSLHGWRDFLIHLATITIGLLIALSLEGCVEWRHHRNLVHEAEASLGTEIRSNAKDLQGALEDVRKEQKVLQQDVAVLKRSIANPRAPNREDMAINFHLGSFDDVSWKTAQSTGALSYMPYERAQEYSAIYGEQEEITAAERQAVRDTVTSVGPFLNSKNGDPNPTGDEAVKIKDRLEVLQAQLTFLESLLLGLDQNYKKFLAAHPE
jgi:hypothetical protein